MNYVVKKFTINTPEEDLLADLVRCAKSLRKKHVSHKEYSRLGSYNCSTYMRRFGSWNNALVKAGLNVLKIINAPEEDLMLNIKHVWDSLKRQPRYNDMVKPVSRFDVRVYVNRYGSWNNALGQFVKFIKFIKSEDSKKLKRKRSKTKSDNLTNLTNLKNPQSDNLKSVTIGLRLDVLARDRFRCRGCGRSPATHNVTLHVDHWLPRAKGGSSEIENLITLCNECNLGKGSKLLGIKPP
jgi:5-methylcytosine-specific restriction endonuclease McrA